MKSGFLKKIVETKKEEVASARRRISEASLRERAQLAREKRPFFQNLATPGPSGVNIIAEIKRASPSKGVFLPGLNPAWFAREYQKGGASAISVLTDKEYFHGGAEDLKAARKASTLPILRKDFLVSSYQIYESAVMGADAILLIVRILSAQQLEEYLALGKALNLDPLVEVNAEAELETATRAGAELIGINNRDLNSFKTTLDTTLRLAPLLAPGQIGVAASGVGARDDIQRVKAAGIPNFLIGESLVRARDPRLHLMTLLSGS